MMKKTPAAGLAALGLGVVLAASACSSSGGGGTSSGGGGGSASSGPVTLTFWNNATPGPGLTYYQNAIKAFEAANPGVTIKMQNIQTEDYDRALRSLGMRHVHHLTIESREEAMSPSKLRVLDGADAVYFGLKHSPHAPRLASP